MMYNSVPSVYLLQQDHAHQLMRKGEPGETDRIVSPVQYLVRKPQGAADDEYEMAFPLNTQSLDLTGQLYRVGHPPG